MSGSLAEIGTWTTGDRAPNFARHDLMSAVQRVREPVSVVRDPDSGRLGVSFGGSIAAAKNGAPSFPLLASLPALYPEWLGDRSFAETHGVRFPYVAGAMANGIATTRLVTAIAEAGALGFFGAAGLAPAEIEGAVHEMRAALEPGGLPWGSNLIHSPSEPELEEAVVDLYLKAQVRRVSAAAYMRLTPAIVRYACSGLWQDAAGNLQRRNHVFAKVSRPEVARHFMQPAPAAMLTALVERGALTADEARLAQHLPLAEDVTAEADSGGHTDNRPLTVLLPTMLALRDEISAAQGYTRPIRVGAAGGLGTPSAVAAAFSLGAAYVLTGTVNQACIESGMHESGRNLLAQAGIADVVMAPAADMFEMGVEVQVLKRGTLFGVRARKLYDMYRRHEALEQIPQNEATTLEADILGGTRAEAWDSTRSYWQARDAREVERAERDPKHKMALVFRSYLGQSSRWAIAGNGDRRSDFQIWCGPAMGAFNAWTRGSFLAEPEQRGVAQVARNLLEGAAVVTRAQQLRTYGVPVPAEAFDFRPRPLD